MKRRTRATWVTRKEVSLFCLDFSGLKSDPAGLAAEIEASDLVIREQSPHTLLLALDLHQTHMAPELVAYLNQLASRRPNPIRKAAIIGLSGWQRFWYSRRKRLAWPKEAAFFNDWEVAKGWLIGERTP